MTSQRSRSQIQMDVDEDDKIPTMTTEERKAKYRILLDKVKILHANEESGLETAQALDDIIYEANTLFKDTSTKERIQYPDEVLLDAKVVGRASDVLLHITDSIDCSLDTYEHLELARNINAKLLNGVEDPDYANYTELAKVAEDILKMPPRFSFLYGAIGDPQIEEKPVKEKKQRTQRNRKEDYANKKEPEKVTAVDKEEDSVDDTVQFLQWALRKECEESGKKQLNYCQFIIDPRDFSATIENVFHCSFLIKDGRAKLEQDKNGLIQISPVSSHESKKAKKQGTKYGQNILSIDMENWQAIIDKFSIKKCFLSKWKSKWDSRKLEEK